MCLFVSLYTFSAERRAIRPTFPRLLRSIFNFGLTTMQCACYHEHPPLMLLERQCETFMSLGFEASFHSRAQALETQQNEVSVRSSLMPCGYPALLRDQRMSGSCLWDTVSCQAFYAYKRAFIAVSVLYHNCYISNSPLALVVASRRVMPPLTSAFFRVYSRQRPYIKVHNVKLPVPSSVKLAPDAAATGELQ